MDRTDCKTYKVWIQVEAYDEDTDEYEEIMLPFAATNEFSDEQEAIEYAEMLHNSAEDLAELIDVLRAAVARIEIANAEGNPILSAWLPDAKAAIAKATGKEA